MHSMRSPRSNRLALGSRGAVTVLLTALAILLAFGVIGEAQTANRPNLVVYTYDSFASWGPAVEIAKQFEEKYNVTVTLVAAGGAGEMLSRLIVEMDTGGTPADVFIGLSDTQLPQALKRNLFLPLDRSLLPNLEHVPKELHIDPEYRVIPFDYGFVSLVYDRRALSEDELPRSLEDLTHPRFRGKVIAIDPRTSSVGHAFLMWTIAEYGDDGYLDFWERLKPSLLTVTGGWSAAYAMFEAGEAPIVVSYTTDPAYAAFVGAEERQGVITPGGQAYRQIELAGIVRGTENVELAHAFLNHLISAEAQALIPTTNWMFPANDAAELPTVFAENAVKPENPIWLNHEVVDQNNERWLREWSIMITR